MNEEEENALIARHLKQAIIDGVQLVNEVLAPELQKRNVHPLTAIAAGMLLGATIAPQLRDGENGHPNRKNSLEFLQFHLETANEFLWDFSPVLQMREQRERELEQYDGTPH